MAKQKRDRRTDPNAPIWAQRINELLMNERYDEHVSRVEGSLGNAQVRSQAELAEFVGVSEATVSGWTNGKVRNGRKEWPAPSARDVARIARFFGVSSDYILGLNDVWGSYYDQPHCVSVCGYLGLSRAALLSIEQIKGLRDSSGLPSPEVSFENTLSRRLPIDTLNELLSDRDLVLLLHDYITSEVVCEAQDFALNDTKADSRLLHIVSELMWMRRRFIKTRPIPPDKA